jgi:hypothetical protein
VFVDANGGPQSKQAKTEVNVTGQAVRTSMDRVKMRAVVNNVVR